MIKSNKAKLLIDISKEIVKQYRNQLEEFINENKEYDENKFFYLYHRTDSDKVLEEAKKNLVLIDSVLKNYENCIFNGKILEDRVVYYVPTLDGKLVEKESELRKDAIYKDVPLPSNSSMQTEAMAFGYKYPPIEEVEVDEVTKGIWQLFDCIQIPSSVTFPIILDVIDRFNAKNYDSSYRLDEEKCSIFANKYFSIDGMYKIDSATFNIGTKLEQNMYNDSLFYAKNKSFEYDYEVLDKNFLINSIPMFDIVKKYINEEANRSLIDVSNLESKNEMKKDILKFLFKNLNRGHYNLNSDNYYFDIFNHDYHAIDSDMVDYLKTNENTKVVVKQDDDISKKIEIPTIEEVKKETNESIKEENKNSKPEIDDGVEESEYVETSDNFAHYLNEDLDSLSWVSDENEEQIEEDRSNEIKKVEYIPQTLLQKLRYNINKLMLNDEAFEMWKEQTGKQRG